MKVSGSDGELFLLNFTGMTRGGDEKFDDVGEEYDMAVSVEGDMSHVQRVMDRSTRLFWCGDSIACLNVGAFRGAFVVATYPHVVTPSSLPYAFKASRPAGVVSK